MKQQPAQSFWVAVGATAGVVIFSLLDWITVADRLHTDRFNLFSSWSQMSTLRREWPSWLGNIPDEIVFMWGVLSVLIGLFTVSVILQITGIVMHHHGRFGARYIYRGHVLFLFVPVIYFILAVIVNHADNATVRPTISIFLACAAAIVGIVSSYKLASRS